MTPHLCRLGPIEFEDAPPAYYYWLLSDAGPPDLVEAANDEEGIATVLRSVKGPRGRITCDQAMAVAGRRHGLTAAEAPAGAAEIRWLIAMGAAHEDLGELKDPSGLIALATAVTRYLQAEPWKRFGSEESFALDATGPRRHTFEAVVLGMAGVEVGLCLYEKPGSLQRLLAQTGDPRTLDCLTILLDDGPDYLCDAFEELTGERCAMHLIKLRGGAFSPLTGPELHTLAAALEAIAGLMPRAQASSASSGSLTVRIALGSTAPEAAPSFAGVGRNEPCPCGSGKKFKKCHLDEVEESIARPAGASPTHAIDDRLCAALTAFAAGSLGAGWEDQFLSAYFDAVKDPAPSEAQLFEQWRLYLHAFSGQTVADAFLKHGAAALAADQRGLLDAQLKSWPGVWEVQRVAPGEGLEVLDLLTGERRFVHEIRSSHTLAHREALLARMVDYEGTSVFVGTHPNPLPPDAAFDAVRAVRALTGQQQPGPQLLRQPDIAKGVLTAWRAALGALEARAKEPAKLTNTDGEPILTTVDRFEVVGDVRQLLCSIEGGLVEEDSDLRTQVTLTRRGNAMHRTWRSTVVGEVKREGKVLKATSNSMARADRLKAQLLELLGPKVKPVARSHEDPVGQLRGVSAAMDMQAGGGPIGIAQLALRWESGLAWLSEPFEQLGGKTPRGAARDPALREQLHVLLKTHEHADARREREPGELIAEPRRELGLSEDGEWIAVDEAWMARGRGLKISEALWIFAGPLLGEVGHDVRSMEEVFAVAVKVWNGLVLGKAPRFKAERKEWAQWLRERFELLFRGDRREIGKWELFSDDGEVGLQAQFRLPAELAAPEAEALEEYDADVELEPSAVLATDPGLLDLLVREYHARGRHDVGQSEELHAAMHVMVETQLATNDPPEVRMALARVRLGGLDRHDAVHAIASVLAEALFKSGTGGKVDEAWVRKTLKKLTAKKWVQDHGGTT